MAASSAGGADTLIGSEMRLIQPVGPALEISANCSTAWRYVEMVVAVAPALELLQHDTGGNGSQDTSCDPNAIRRVERGLRVASAAPAAWS